MTQDQRDAFVFLAGVLTATVAGWIMLAATGGV